MIIIICILEKQETGKFKTVKWFAKVSQSVSGGAETSTQVSWFFTLLNENPSTFLYLNY